MAGKHTPGPWRFEVNGTSVHLLSQSQRGLVVMSFGLFGYRSAQPLFRDENNLLLGVSECSVVCPGREHHDWFRLVKHPDAQLIEAAPDLWAYADFEERLEAFARAVEGIHDYARIWQFIGEHLPEIERECPPLTEAQLAGYEEEARVDLAFARAHYWGYTEFESGYTEGHFCDLVRTLGEQKRRAALAHAAGGTA